MTPIQRLSVAGLLIFVAAGATACQSKRQQGLAAQVPDDFRVVQRAPLEIPPEYALRPPSPGEPRPQELDPEAAARSALNPVRADPTATAGERSLVARAGGLEASAVIKAVVDDEQGDLAHKSKAFADLVMFWKQGDSTVATARDDNTSTPIDPAAEATRLASLTGGQNVTIVKAQSKASTQQRRLFKLPGL